MDIFEEIANFQPKNGVWLELDKLIEKISWLDSCEIDYSALFSVFERYPQDDGAGVLWSIIHFCESKGDYEEDLVASLTKAPSEMGLVMINRILNTKIESDFREKLIEVLSSSATNSSASDRVKKCAIGFLAYQNNKIA